MKIPKIIYIQVAKNETGEEDLIAWRYSKNAEDGEVAVYYLDDLMTKTTKTFLSPKN